MGRDKKEIPFWAKLGHAKPLNRREFLATGMIPFAAWAVAPSISVAAELDCPVTGGYIPLITVNLAGGPSLASQLVVKNLNGGNLPSYTKLGLGSGPALSFKVEKEFGNVEFAGEAIGGQTQGLVSKFLTGMRSPRGEAARNAALDKTAFIWNAVALTDDSSANQLDITGMAIKMGLSGSKLPNLGRSDTSTGIGQKAATTPPPAPFIVGSVDDLTNALGYSSAMKNASLKQKTALARAISSLSNDQVKRISESSPIVVLNGLLQCAGIRNIDLISAGSGDVNPFVVGGTLSTEMLRIWGVQANDKTSQNAIFGSMVYNGLTGNAASINLNMGGYDYHDATRTTGDTRDLEAGRVIGKILETAAMLNKQCFIYVCADGATSSAESATADSPWMSDRGIAGMQYALAFDPAKRPDTSGFQIGGFNDAQAADGKSPTGTSAEVAAQAIFANYASWNGRNDFLDQNRIGGDASVRAQSVKLHKG